MSASEASPTDEQIRAAHKALDLVGCYRSVAANEDLEAIRAALPPLPKPKSPRITPIGEWNHIHPQWEGIRESIRTRDAEIKAWLEWKRDNMNPLWPSEFQNGWSRCCTMLLQDLKEAGS